MANTKSAFGSLHTFFSFDAVSGEVSSRCVGLLISWNHKRVLPTVHPKAV
jgi:hypothetical protein